MLLPPFHWHAVMHKMAYFQKWTSGFEYIGTPNVIWALRHVVLCEISKISVFRHSFDWTLQNMLDQNNRNRAQSANRSVLFLDDLVMMDYPQRDQDRYANNMASMSVMNCFSSKNREAMECEFAEEPTTYSKGLPIS